MRLIFAAGTLLVPLGALSFSFGFLTHDWKASQATVDVVSERHVIPGYNEPNTPPNVPVSDGLRAAITDPDAIRDGAVNLNQAIYVRFFDRNRTTPPKTIIILVPGLAAGANAFRLIATEVVQLSSGEVEVWAVDRRANLLEDLRGMVKAEAAATELAAREALDFYTYDPAGRGGYIANNPFGEVSRFMSEWGLDVHVRDLKAVVDQARTIRGATIFLGGHSIGAVIAQAFAAYNFEGVPGYSLLSGLILLDGTAIPGRSMLTDEQYLNGSTNEQGTTTGINYLRSPRGPGDEPFVTEPLDPFKLQLLEISALLALAAPEGRSPLDQILPELFPVPMTNAAALGTNVDDEFQVEPFARFSIGFLNIPKKQSIMTVATQTADPYYTNPNGLYVPRNLGASSDGIPILQGWASVKNLKTLSSAFTVGPEPSDLRRVALAFMTGNGHGETLRDANFAEWYFPQRLLLDVMRLFDLDATKLPPAVVAAMTARGGRCPALTENRKVNVPVLAIQAKSGIFPPFYGSLPFTLYKGKIKAPRFIIAQMPNYSHGDILTGTDKGTLGKDVSELILSFVNGLL